jgi:hypothetical protein
MAMVTLTGCSTVPNRSADADAITADLQALPGVHSVDGRYAHGAIEGYSYNVEIEMVETASVEEVVATATTYYTGLVDADFRKHTTQFAVRLGDDLLQVFGNDRHRDTPTAEVRRWYQLVHDIPAEFNWAVGPDPARDVRSISVQVDEPQRLIDFTDRLPVQAADLADRQWIIRWHLLRMDLMGPQYPAAGTLAAVAQLADDEQWTATYRSDGDPALTVGVWATAPGEMESAARLQLPVLQLLGMPVSYTVRADRTAPVEVLLGGCLQGGSALQQRLNQEFGAC